ncbi:MAG: ABC transporter ATP-binding protein [Acidimicrobiales bacterium]|nr:ABC transporter ATP-binding protein [Acidimicrobiales bacterium]MCB9393856.1 ABC transporter ATP-binding protein [Acidimicrobiaceae bacterium]
MTDTHSPDEPRRSTVATEVPPALAVEDLEVAYVVRGIPRQVLRGVSFHVAPGEAYGLVGESGCGKSTTAYSALRYLPRNGRITGGRVLVDGSDITSMSDAELREFRASKASMVYQDPGSALNPTIKVGPQVVEAFRILGQSKTEAQTSALHALQRVRIADPARVLGRYPHQLSGGMLQRVVIAMALACNPRLLVLDEPTTGLDATVEAEVLDLVRALRTDTDSAILLIAHNLGVIRSMCDRVGVMYAGTVVEEGDASQIFDRPQHPYTVGLLRALPRRGLRKTERSLATIPGALPQIGADLPGCVFVDRCELATHECRTVPPPVVDLGDGRSSRCHHIDRIPEIREPEAGAVVASEGETVLQIAGVSKTFRQSGHDVPALVGVDLSLADGETLGLVGESGSGKSTLAKAILGIHAPDAGGELTLDQRQLATKISKRSSDDKRAMQIVFQNPDSALNSAWTVRKILRRSVQKLTGLNQQAADDRVAVLADHLRLSPRHLDLKPSQLSGGLKQRVAIARAFAGDPRIVVCDEPTSALDVSVQAAILNLLAELQAEQRTSYVFISHDLGVVRYLADRIAVMYLGRIMEIGATDDVFAGPHHPYTEALLSAVPSVDGEPSTRIRLDGEIPSPANPPSGCVFHPRCPRFIEGTCDREEPPMVEVSLGHVIRCHIPPDELRVLQARTAAAADATEVDAVADSVVSDEPR